VLRNIGNAGPRLVAEAGRGGAGPAGRGTWVSLEFTALWDRFYSNRTIPMQSSDGLLRLVEHMTGVGCLWSVMEAGQTSCVEAQQMIMLHACDLLVGITVCCRLCLRWNPPRRASVQVI